MFDWYCSEGLSADKAAVRKRRLTKVSKGRIECDVVAIDGSSHRGDCRGNGDAGVANVLRCRLSSRPFCILTYIYIY